MTLLILTSHYFSPFYIIGGSLQKSKSIECPGYDTKLHLMVRLQSCSFEECGVPFHCHYSQVDSDPDW